MKTILALLLLMPPSAHAVQAIADLGTVSVSLPAPAIAAPEATLPSIAPSVPQATILAPLSAAGGLRAKAAAVWQKLRGKAAEVQVAQDEGKDPKAALDAQFSGSAAPDPRAFAAFDVAPDLTYQVRRLPHRTIEQFCKSKHGRKALVEQRISQAGQSGALGKVSRFTRDENGKLRIETEDLAGKSETGSFYDDDPFYVMGGDYHTTYSPSKEKPLRVSSSSHEHHRANPLHPVSYTFTETTETYFQGRKVLIERATRSGRDPWNAQPRREWLDGEGRPIAPR